MFRRHNWVISLIFVWSFVAHYPKIISYSFPIVWLIWFHLAYAYETQYQRSCAHISTTRISSSSPRWITQVQYMLLTLFSQLLQRTRTTISWDSSWAWDLRAIMLMLPALRWSQRDRDDPLKRLFLLCLDFFASVYVERNAWRVRACEDSQQQHKISDLYERSSKSEWKTECETGRDEFLEIACAYLSVIPFLSVNMRLSWRLCFQPWLLYATSAARRCEMHLLRFVHIAPSDLPQ